MDVYREFSTTGTRGKIKVTRIFTKLPEYLILLLLTLSSSCVHGYLSSYEYNEFATVEEISAQFEVEALKRGVILDSSNYTKIQLDWGFEKLSPEVRDALAFCNSDNEIHINAKMWNYDRNDSREMVLFHELGHCMLGREHREDLIDEDKPNQRPVSIMYPRRSILSISTYRKYRTEYLDELFGQKCDFTCHYTRKLVK